MERKKPEAGTEVLHREVLIDKRGIDAEKRTVELAFSSETRDVKRWYGTEILDHSPKSVRLGRLNDGGAVLVNHNSDKQVGVVESAKIDADRVGRAVVRFGKGAEADAVFQDILDGIRRKVSVGYMVHEYVLESSTEEGDTYRVTDWEPTEVSIVAVPADNTVGVGRNKETKSTTEQKETRTMDPKTETPATPAAPAAPAAPPVDVRAITEKAQQEARTNELKRINALEGIGEKFKDFGGPELARKAIAEGWDEAKLNEAILARAGEKKPVPDGKIGMSDKEIRQYSFLKVLHALANPGDKRAQEMASYERELSDAAVEKRGSAAQGILVPYDVLCTPLKRDLTVGTATAGGHTVATDLLAGSFIDLLRKRMVLNALGATTLNGLVGNVAIPRQTGSATAYWVAESGAPTESQQAFDQVTLSPKTVGAFTDFSRKLFLQSSIDVENLVRGDLIKVLGLEIDRVGLYGTGSSNQPLGVKNTSGINTKDFAAMAPTFAEIVGLETEVAADNADIGTLAYLVNARGRGSLKTTEKASSTGQFIWEQGNTVNGYRCEVSNQVEGNGSSTEDYFFGNWADLLIGFWSGLDLMVDPYSNSTSGTVRVVALQDVDVAVRHPESFCRGANTL